MAAADYGAVHHRQCHDWLDVGKLLSSTSWYYKTLTVIQCTTGASLVLGEIVAGMVFKYIGHFRWQLVAAAVCLTSFVGLMASTTQYTEGRAITVRNTSYITTYLPDYMLILTGHNPRWYFCRVD
jgi:hypothetical protein